MEHLVSDGEVRLFALGIPNDNACVRNAENEGPFLRVQTTELGRVRRRDLDKLGRCHPRTEKTSGKRVSIPGMPLGM